jgi:hypothetical protein
LVAGAWPESQEIDIPANVRRQGIAVLDVRIRWLSFQSRNRRAACDIEAWR